jgi:hypothetical protein
MKPTVSGFVSRQEGQIRPARCQIAQDRRPIAAGTLRIPGSKGSDLPRPHRPNAGRAGRRVRIVARHALHHPTPQTGVTRKTELAVNGFPGRRRVEDGIETPFFQNLQAGLHEPFREAAPAPCRIGQDHADPTAVRSQRQGHEARHPDSGRQPNAPPDPFPQKKGPIRERLVPASRPRKPQPVGRFVRRHRLDLHHFRPIRAPGIVFTVHPSGIAV